jgi:hypothetical protein
MSISNFYNAIVNSGSKPGPTFEESRHDYRRAHEARTAGTFGFASHARASAALRSGFGGN